LSNTESNSGGHAVHIDIAVAEATRSGRAIVTFGCSCEEPQSTRHDDSGHYGQQKNYGSKGYIEALGEDNSRALFRVARTFTGRELTEAALHADCGVGQV